MINPACQDIYEAFSREFFIKNPDKLPSNISFDEHRDQLCAADWIGPPPLIGDPDKMSRASERLLINRATTLEREAANIGLDWRTMLRQQKREQEMMDSLGLKNQRLEEIEIQQSTVEPGDEPGDGE